MAVRVIDLSTSQQFECWQLLRIHWLENNIKPMDVLFFSSIYMWEVFGIWEEDKPDCWELREGK